MTEVSQEAREAEVTEQDRNLRRAILKCIIDAMDTPQSADDRTDDIDRLIARHRQQAKRGEAVACRYPVHGSVTHVRNVECCDFCGYPADTLPTPPEAV